MTAQLIMLGSEVCKIKLHPQESVVQAHELTDLIDRLLPEFREPVQLSGWH